MKNNFLTTSNHIKKDVNEYNQLLNIERDLPKEKSFLIQLKNISYIKNNFSSIISNIRENYNTFSISLFTFSNENITIENIFNSSINETELLNFALKTSKEKQTYIFFKTENKKLLIYNGEFDNSFDNQYANFDELKKMIKQEFTLYQLPYLFDKYKLDRLHFGCNFISNNRIIDEISEQILRNNLLSFLKEHISGFVSREYCTDSEADEESVDISIIDLSKKISIIEVKFFIKAGFTVSNQREYYGKYRFKDGYEQLDRYCKSMEAEGDDIISAYLYMFYATTEKEGEVKNKANQYFNKVNKSPEFNRHYKDTIYDRLVE